MVTDTLFLIDSTFLLKANETAFLGAPLLVDKNGCDHTQTFAFMRDLLRLRKKFGIRRAVVLVGEESVDATSTAVLDDLLLFLHSIKAAVVRQDSARILDICGQLASSAQWVISANRSLHQLVTDSFGIIHPSHAVAAEIVTKKVLTGLGIRPDFVPAVLALSDGKDAPLKRQQAVRVLELYGNLEAALADVSNAPSAAWKRKLAPKKDGLLQAEEGLRVRPPQLTASAESIEGKFIEDSKQSSDVLKAYGFRSLIRMLPLPDAKAIMAVSSNDRKTDYRAIRNHADLSTLEEYLSEAKVCAIDTETSGKDPRSATLFGVSLSVKERQAFFVPIMKADLEGLSPEDVCVRLNKALTPRLKLVGHNFKYDFAILQRNGIGVQTPYFDTMIAAFECFGDWEFWNLSAIAKKLLGESVKRYREIVGTGETFLDRSFKELVEHACCDADVTLRLYAVLTRELRKRQIEEQFLDGAMQIERLLIECERDGVRVDIERMKTIGEAVKGSVDALRAAAFASAGCEFDIDSKKATSESLRKLGIWGKTTQSLNDSQMEQIAAEFPVVKDIVKYRRERKRYLAIESICADSKNGRVYASLSQIKNAHGCLHAGSPSLDEAVAAGTVVDPQLLGLFGDAASALRTLVEASDDATLREDLKRTGNGGFIPGVPVVNDIDHGKLLVLAAIGESDLAISRRFLLSRPQVLAFMSVITSRYLTLFSWLEDFKRTSIAKGFAEYRRRRKYIEGLRSSDIDKRSKAVRSAIRWLMQSTRSYGKTRQAPEGDVTVPVKFSSSI